MKWGDYYNMLREHNRNITHTRGDHEVLPIDKYISDIDITREYKATLVVTDKVNYDQVNLIQVPLIDDEFTITSDLTSNLEPKVYRYYIVILYTDNNTRDTLGPYSYSLIKGVDKLWYIILSRWVQ